MTPRSVLFDMDDQPLTRRPSRLLARTILAMTRADTHAAVMALARVAIALGAERSITEQDREQRLTAVGVSANAEAVYSRILVRALRECPTVVAASGVTADDLSGDLTAASDAAVFAEHAGQLARGANEAAQVLGLSIEAVVQRTTTGLAAIAAAASDPEVAAAARTDAETINEPLQSEVDQRSARSHDTRRATAAAAAALKAAEEVARFHAITARIREGAPVSKRDALWARDFASDHPEILAPASMAPPEKVVRRKRRPKGRQSR